MKIGTSSMITAGAEIPEADSIQGVLEPTGFRLLVRIPDLEAQMKGWSDLYMPDETRRLEESAQLTAQVIAIGPDAYQDATKFPTGPWCKVGDYIVMRAYAGTRFTIRRTLYCLINDDTVQGVVRGDHKEIERAF
jgi:co-chaperonin GroES (HSP10)